MRLITKLILAIAISFSSYSTCFAGVLFDNVDDLVRNATAVGLTNYPFSIYIYAKCNTTSSREDFYSIANSAASNRYISIVCGDNPNNYTYEVRNAGVTFDATNYSVATSTTSTDTNFHSILVVSASSTSHKIYIDGVLEDTDTNSTGFPTGLNRSAVGCLYRSSILYGNVQVSEVAVWASELTAKDAALLAGKTRNIPLQVSPANLKLYLKLDEKADGLNANAITFKDSSSTGTSYTGDDGANNTGLTAKAESNLSYP